MIRTWKDFLKVGLDEQKKYVEERRNKGYADKQIAWGLGASAETFAMWKKKHNLQRKSTEHAPRQNTEQSLCWGCKNACGNCAWSKCLVPVEGWTVEETASPTWVAKWQRMIPSVRVVDCPKFIGG